MENASEARPIALTIAGSDSSGGAGIQADLKTFSALGVYGASVITAVTAQNTLGVQGVHAVPSDFVIEQLVSVVTDLKVAAIKTGMLSDRETVTSVADACERLALKPLVVDPVMVATSGDDLLAADAISAYAERLFPQALIVTPNLQEAARLLDCPVATNVDDMKEQGQALLAFGPQYVLVKGGHTSAADAVDVLVGPDLAEYFVALRVDTKNTHGTGCTLSAAIAANLAKGLEVSAAVEAAKQYLTRALTSGAGHALGHGVGPVDHLVSFEGH